MFCDVVGRLFQGSAKKGLCVMDFFAGASCTSYRYLHITCIYTYVCTKRNPKVST